MSKSLYESKNKMETATPFQKACSKFQRKLNRRNKELENYKLKNRIRSEQMLRDHNFKEVFMELFPKQFEIVKDEFVRRHGRGKKLKDLKKELKSERNLKAASSKEAQNLE